MLSIQQTEKMMEGRGRMRVKIKLLKRRSEPRMESTATSRDYLEAFLLDSYPSFQQEEEQEAYDIRSRVLSAALMWKINNDIELNVRDAYMHHNTFGWLNPMKWA